MTRTLSKSDFTLARTCITKLYYKELGYPQNVDESPYLAMLAEGGYMIEQLARLMYPDGLEVPHGADPAADWAETQRRLQAKDVTLFEATLLAGRKHARVDILVKRGAHFDLIEVKSKSISSGDRDRPNGPFRGLKDWQPYLEDVGYQTLVLRTLFPDATIASHLLLVDKNGTTTIDRLPEQFTILRHVDERSGRKHLEVKFTGDAGQVNPDEILVLFDVSKEVEELMPSIKTAVAELEQIYRHDGVTKVARPLDSDCRNCEFRVGPNEARNGFNECWGELGKTTPHVFDLHYLTAKVGNALIRAAKTSLYDVDSAMLVDSKGEPTKRSVRQLVQIEHTRTGRPWFGEELSRDLDRLGWPLHFVDFETSQIAVPYHAGMRPYEKVAFQWSCHTLAGPNEAPVHSEWLNAKTLWPNEEFVRSLRNAIGDDGRVLTWTSFEATTLKHIAAQLRARGSNSSDVVAWIEGLVATPTTTRLFDLNELCLRAFFHPGMKGRTSIKVVLDALWRDDRTMRERYEAWATNAIDVPEGSGPYESLPPIQLDGNSLNVFDGTGAMHAYQAMLYGVENDKPKLVKAYDQLLRRYCELDTLAMVLVWDYWRRAASAT